MIFTTLGVLLFCRFEKTEELNGVGFRADLCVDGGEGAVVIISILFQRSERCSRVSQCSSSTMRR